mmetsp:Transcript_30711/g.35827  ORF Transcript_30711/g.35827 Transcript_30711/m.35827 type:complete len:96 (-) Transcript_30711:980-1267(-)
MLLIQWASSLQNFRKLKKLMILMTILIDCVRVTYIFFMKHYILSATRSVALRALELSATSSSVAFCFPSGFQGMGSSSSLTKFPYKSFSRLRLLP